jgi:hypothetical protein
MFCNFEVNLITRLEVIALFSSFISSPDPKGHVRTIQGTFLLSLVPIGPVVSEKKLEM